MKKLHEIISAFVLASCIPVGCARLVDTDNPDHDKADPQEASVDVQPLIPIVIEQDRDEPPIETEELRTTIGLCEPIDQRWDYPTQDQRERSKDLIKETCKAMGVGSQDCKFFYGIISTRESDHRPWVRHKLASDTSAALSAYMRRAHDYGWSVRWTPEGRKAEDVSKLEYMAYGDSQNPYFLDASRWMFGLGLGGLNISYHLSKFDHLAPPEILCDPVINAMIQITIARISVSRYGAKNFAEVQAVYGGRTVPDENGTLVPLSCTRGCPKGASREDIARARSGDADILRRCSSHGLDCHKRPQLGGEIRLESMSIGDRYAAADAIRGESLPSFDAPPEAALRIIVEPE